MQFELESKYSPSGDQPDAIKKLVEGFQDGLKEQVLLGVTGSGKTFTMANIIKEINCEKILIKPSVSSSSNGLFVLDNNNFDEIQNAFNIAKNISLIRCRGNLPKPMI